MEQFQGGWNSFTDVGTNLVSAGTNPERLEQFSEKMVGTYVEAVVSDKAVHGDIAVQCDRAVGVT